MKKIIAIILIGLLSACLLTACGGDGGKFEGTFQNEKDQYGKSFYERVILTKQDDGYRLEKKFSLPSSTLLEFSHPETIGNLRKEGGYLGAVVTRCKAMILF